MKKIALICNIALLALIVAGDLSYMLVGGLALKGVSSFLFLLVGILNLIFLFVSKVDKKNKLFAIFLCVGLFFAMLGDIFLNIHFVSGAVLFAIGHIFYFVSYTILQKVDLWEFVISTVILIPSVLFMVLAPMFDFGSPIMEIVALVYALIISLMVGKAIFLCIKQKTSTSVFIAIGSILFFVSDFMLLLHNFGSVGIWAGAVCLATYYPAQFLLGFSLWTILNKNTNVQ